MLINLILQFGAEKRVYLDKKGILGHLSKVIFRGHSHILREVILAGIQQRTSPGDI